jgi:hypothetical protein
MSSILFCRNKLSASYPADVILQRKQMEAIRLGTTIIDSYYNFPVGPRAIIELTPRTRSARIKFHGSTVRRSNSYIESLNGRLNHARIPMPRCASPCDRDSETARKQSHDEKSRFCRIVNDAGCDLRTGACGHGRTEGAVLAQSDRPLSPASGTRLQCFRSGDRDANGRAQCAPLSWRTEIELLTV